MTKSGIEAGKLDSKFDLYRLLEPQQIPCPD